jgi:hypothetical protein
MLCNWKHAALNRLFQHCGSALLNEKEQRRYERLGAFSIPRLRRACLCYNAKTSQIFTLRERLRDNCLFIIDYEKLTSDKNTVLPAIYSFIGLPYRDEYAAKLHSGSLNKAKIFYEWHRNVLDSTCMPVYEKACALVTM